MKKFYILALVAAMFAACATDATEDVAIGVPETLRVSFEDEDSRIQLANGKTVWTKGDQVSVFYRSNANQKWQYKGETGERVGELQQVDAGSATREMDRVVVVYPYNESYYINPSTCNVQASLPAVQTYLADSYGLNGNIMISHGEYNNISLKSVCGWLKLQLTGNSEKVQTITLKGNNGEQVAGEIYINSADATAILSSDAGDADDGELGSAGGNLIFEDTLLTEVTLNCGEGVTLSAEPTAFYIALPPQEFGKGLTVEVVCSDGSTMTKSTEKEVVIARNTIQPMAAFEFINPNIETTPKPANNEIWYTSSDEAVVEPYKSDVFGANIVSNTYENGKGVIKFDGNVTSIGMYAFRICTSLTSITIPDSVTEIGTGAFFLCTSLTRVYCYATIPSLLGGDAFCSNASARRIYVYEECVELYKSAWSDYKDAIYTNGKNCPDTTTIEYTTNDGNIITSSKLPIMSNSYENGVGILIVVGKIVQIPYYAFRDCTRLTSITIPDSVTSIGLRTFEGCTSLTSITIGDRVTEIGLYAFYNCTSLTSVTIPKSVTSIGGYAFSGCSSLTSLTIPNSVTSIGGGAFYGCTSLTSVTIPDSVTEIRGDAFRECTSLTSVTIPDSVTEIGECAFWGCRSLTSITIPDSVTEIGRCAFYLCSCLNIATIGNSVTSIGVSAFYGCTSLTGVTIPDSVTSIGNSAFAYCTSLTSVTIGDSVISIGHSAFEGCTSLTSVTIGDSVTEIGEEAFYECTSLISVTIPDSVTSIGDWAFYDCTSLKKVYCKPTTPPSGGSYMFSRNTSGLKIYIPRASVDAYKAAEYWSDYKSDIEPYDFE